MNIVPFPPAARLRERVGAIAIALVVAAATGCRSAEDTPNLGGLYNQSAMHHGESRNPVIVLPGILGSRLKDSDSGRLAWGAFSGDYADPDDPRDQKLIALPMEKGRPLSELRDSIIADGALDRVEVDIFGLATVELTAYLQILGTLGVGGYRDMQLGESGVIDYGTDHYTCFQFPYDWRRDLIESVRELDRAIQSYRADVRQNLADTTGSDVDVRFDMVAHSMGGLVARYYLRYGTQDLPADGSLPELNWAGAKLIDRLILVATPSAGSAEAILQLVEGYDPGPIIPTYHAGLLGTMPAIYQLLPRERHLPLVDRSSGQPVVGLFDPELWARNQWGLLNPSQDEILQQILPEAKTREARVEIAKDHIAKCLARAEQFHRALDLPARRPDGLEIHLFAGDAIDTLYQVSVDGDGRTRRHAAGPGDGTVLRASALMDERVAGEWSPRLQSPIEWSSVRLQFEDHIGITQDPAFVDNVLYILLESPLGRFGEDPYSERIRPLEEEVTSKPKPDASR